MEFHRPVVGVSGPAEGADQRQRELPQPVASLEEREPGRPVGKGHELQPSACIHRAQHRPQAHALEMPAAGEQRPVEFVFKAPAVGDRQEQRPTFDQHALGLGDRLGEVLRVFEHEVGDDEIEGLIREGQGFSRRCLEPNVRRPRLGLVGLTNVNSRDVESRVPRILETPPAAPEVEDTRPGGKCPEQFVHKEVRIAGVRSSAGHGDLSHPGRAAGARCPFATRYRRSASLQGG